MPRVMVVDDEQVLREGLRRILQSFDDIDVPVVCAGAEALEQARLHGPDVVLLDLRMPDRDGLTVLADLRSLPSPPAVAMLTNFDAEESLSAALRGGAAGFLLKDTAPEQLVHAVRALADGGSVIAPRLTRTVVDGFVRAQPEHRPPLAPGAARALTERERGVLVLLADGMSNAEIARHLAISPATAKEHVSAILAKLGVANRVQAAVAAYRAGLHDAA